MSQTLGLEKRKFLFLCQYVFPMEDIATVIYKLINFIGMTPAREARLDSYPYKGKGGEGYTGFFPLMESYVMVDAYTNLGHTEILLSTCKPNRAHPGAIVDFLNKEFGPTRFIGTL